MDSAVLGLGPDTQVFAGLTGTVRGFRQTLTHLRMPLSFTPFAPLEALACV
jgi:hypothetical protein